MTVSKPQGSIDRSYSTTEIVTERSANGTLKRSLYSPVDRRRKQVTQCVANLALVATVFIFTPESVPRQSKHFRVILYHDG